MQINVFHRHIRALSADDLHAATGCPRLCAMLKEGVQAHTGITEGTFYRDQGWYFYHARPADLSAPTRPRGCSIRGSTRWCRGPSGRRRISTPAQWNALLRAAAGYHAFRREHPHGFRPVEVAGFLLANTAFPRAVALNLSQIEWHLSQLRLRYHLRGCAAGAGAGGQSVRRADA